MTKASIPQGTRDFGPDVVRKRNYIINIIKSVFELYGFQPLETPAMENLDTLMGKYGDEGDKLIFKILNNGLENPEKETQVREDFEKVLQGKNNKGITERALKYDLTIPFARYVAMNHNILNFPFKRYQVQPVWRADRPQKGRYREFYQCDADVVGSQNLLNEVELVSIYHQVFTRLGLNGFELRINSRKILSALAEICGGLDKMTDITVAIDKLDKVGIDKVKEELSCRGLMETQIQVIEKYLKITGSNDDILTSLTELIGSSNNGRNGISELSYLNTQIKTQIKQLKIDPTLARGLNYYTGIIFEAKAPAAVKMGSIGGGGRYDDLTGLFGVPNIPGVGISFGVDRIYDVLEELKLFPELTEIGTQVLFLNHGERESQKSYELIQKLRTKNIRAELFHENIKVDKQYKYADNKNIPYVISISYGDLIQNKCTIKNTKSGVRNRINSDIIELFPFNEQSSEKDTELTENDFIQLVIENYQNQLNINKDQRIIKGKQQQLNSLAEDLFAKLLSSKLPSKYKIIIEGTLSSNTKIFYPDLTIIESNKIKHFIEFKIDLKNESRFFKRINEKLNLVSNESRVSINHELNEIKKSVKHYTLSPSFKWHIVCLSDLHKIKSTENVLRNPLLKIYYLTRNFHPKDKNIEQLDIDYSTFKEIYNNLCL